MVPFAGYSLPVQYPAGVLKSHLHTRSADGASLFDVGHMGQLMWHGKDRAAFLEYVTVVDTAAIKEGASKLTVVTTEHGGILDDSVISNHGDYHYMVVNGATKYEDMKHFDRQMEEFSRKFKGGAKADVRYDYLHTRNLVALQGPASSKVLARLVEPGQVDVVQKMAFMTGIKTTVAGVPDCFITRCGYTGEDGYEISMPYESAVKVATAILGNPEVLPAGLGPRDSLRLEAGLCLYGHDIDTSTSPVEAGLTWTITKNRRAKGGFLGDSHILGQINNPATVQRKRVGLNVEGAPAREGAKIFTRPANGSTSPADAKEIGVVTSGTFSPTLNRPIAMGYIATPQSPVDTEVSVEVRGKLYPAKVASMPFVPARYFRGN